MFGFVFYRLSFSPFPLSSFIGSSLLFNLQFVSLAFSFVNVSSSAKIQVHFVKSLKSASRFLGFVSGQRKF